MRTQSELIEDYRYAIQALMDAAANIETTLDEHAERDEEEGEDREPFTPADFVSDIQSALSEIFGAVNELEATH